MERRVLYRLNKDTAEELAPCCWYFPTHHAREHFIGKEPCEIVGRYSVLPNYDEVHYGLQYMGHKLINTQSDHNYIARGDYMFLIKETPKTWTYDDFINEKPDGQFVVKGVTNSKKFYWDTDMFAEDFSAAVKVATRLRADSFLESQDIVVREYVPLVTHEIGLHGLPFSNEYRLFFINGKYMCGGYYWAIAENIPTGVPEEAIAFAKSLKIEVPFVCIDVAETKDGRWILIELNDAQMSGLSTIKPGVFYASLYDGW